MDIKEIASIIRGTIVCEVNSKEFRVEQAFASDLMSDVLTLNTESLLLVTGLANMQTIRTAEMAEIKNILFVRNKKPTPAMLDLAKEEGINIIVCSTSMFAACSELSNAGLKPVY